MRKTIIRNLLLSLAVIILAASTLAGCADDKSVQPRDVSDESPSEMPIDEGDAPITFEPPAEPEPAPYTEEAVLLAVGDIMMHSPQITAGYDAKTDTYNFNSFFTEVEPILRDGDWVVANLETTLAGKSLRFTGYPEFNSPEVLTDALKNAGFNILTTANNHSLDRREKGVINTLENIRSRGFVSTGTAVSAEEADEILIVSKNDIAMAILAYTYGTNGIPIPQGKSYLVNLIDPERIEQDIAKAREAGADVVTIALHFGNEYQLKPSEEQINLTKRLIGAGADIILGSHPHVVQPYDYIEAESKDGTLRNGFVIYSMGNFISNQDRSQTKKPTDVGVIVSIKIKKHFPEASIELADVKTIPTYVHRFTNKGKRAYRVLPLERVIETKADPYLRKPDFDRLETYLADSRSHLDSLTVPVNR